MNECSGNARIISDPMYEEIISDLISAGTMLKDCSHEEEQPCKLCISTWEGCVENANTLMKGRRILKGIS